MKINSELMSYLNDETFSDGYIFHIDKQKETFTRIQYIEHLVKDKNVIHFGCCDHLPLIDEKIKNGQWLHKIITDSSARALGIDINEEGIDYLTEDLGYKNVICKNILEQEVQEIISKKWDYIILGEILEHVDNPVAFLQEIATKYAQSIDSIIITVPNIMSKFYGLNMLENKEMINSDHKYWFTPFTILKVILRASIVPVELKFADHVVLEKRSFLDRIIKKLGKTFATNSNNDSYSFSEFVTLVAIGKFKK